MNNDLIKKYLNGECTPEEEEQVLQYLGEGNEHTLHEHIVSLEKTVDSNVTEAVSASLWQNIQSSIKAGRRKGLLTQLNKWQVAAAVLVIVSVAGLSLWKILPAARESGKWTSLHNTDQQVRKISMPDGTTIWLNARATLSYNEQAYNGKDREVIVTGEAYFDVAGNPEKPFRVRTGSVTTEVLGTAFNVEHYGNENDIRITLVQGKVAVAADNVKQILSPGQRMSYNISRHAMEVQHTDVTSTKEWLNGKLVFNDIPLADVLKRIATTCNINIVCSQPALLEGKRLTGTYTRKGPADLLRQILFVHGLHLEEKSGQFIIKP